MISRKISIIALVTMIFMATAVGNAFALSFSGSDSTQINAPNSISQISTAYGDPYILQNQAATWANSQYDNDANTAYYGSNCAWTDGRGVQGSSTNHWLFYGNSWTPSGMTSAQTQSLGWYSISNNHRYAWDGTSTVYSYSFSNRYYVGS